MGAVPSVLFELVQYEQDRIVNPGCDETRERGRSAFVRRKPTPTPLSALSFPRHPRDTARSRRPAAPANGERHSYAIVTETYPPEVNGVALTVQGWNRAQASAATMSNWCAPRQDGDRDIAADTLLVRGAGLPRYPGLKFGLPATRTLRKRWQSARPNAICTATEGPLAGRHCAPRASWYPCRHRLPHPLRRLHARLWRNQGVALRWMRRYQQQRAGDPGAHPRTAALPARPGLR